MTNKKTIHIAYALDENFLECTCVSATSLLANTTRNVCFHVLESHLSEKSKHILQSIVSERSEVEWFFYHIEKESSGFKATHVAFTVETYYRLLLPQVCAQLDKILYIDGDTVINGDISELFDYDIGNNYVAAVFEQGRFVTDDKHKEILNIPEDSCYFNAGVLLINLILWRNADFYSKAVNCVSVLRTKFEQNKLAWLDDQEVINYLADGKVLKLPPKYNFTLYNEGEITKNNYTVNEWKEAVSNFVILHNCGKAKPFIRGRLQLRNLEFELYYKYKNMSPLSDVNDEARVREYRRREKLSEEALIFSTAMYIEVNKYKIFKELAVNIKKCLKSRKLVIWGNTLEIRLLIVELACEGMEIDKIVDGTVQKQGQKVFDYIVEDSNLLSGKNDEYYVVLPMRQKKIADKVIAILGSYGYMENDIHYVFKELYDSIGGAE